MSKDKGFVDTTILTDRLLKTGEKGQSSRQLLEKYQYTELPVYAIKEFKAGPLRYFRWFHNKLFITKSFAETIAALQKLSLTPQRYLTATAIEALKEAAREVGKLTSKELVEKYGETATLDSMQCDSYKYATKIAIYKAWLRRRSVTTKVEQSLSCYPETEPFDKKGLIEIDPTQCKPAKECCLGSKLRANVDNLKKLVVAIDVQPPKSENLKRRRILHEISRKPRQPVPEDYCRALGDAYFALFCPDDAVILTSNTRDHQPLADALGKEVDAPKVDSK